MSLAFSLDAIPFVGRTAEMDALLVRLDAARAGAGSVVLLVGEAGAGKTRLAEEFERRAHECGGTVVWGRCYEDDGLPPFWPWTQALRRLLLSLPVDALRQVLAADAAVIAD